MQCHSRLEGCMLRKKKKKKGTTWRVFGLCLVKKIGTLGISDKFMSFFYIHLIFSERSPVYLCLRSDYFLDQVWTSFWGSGLSPAHIYTTLSCWRCRSTRNPCAISLGPLEVNSWKGALPNLPTTWGGFFLLSCDERCDIGLRLHYSHRRSGFAISAQMQTQYPERLPDF